MSDPIDAILRDAFLLVIVIIVLLFAVGVLFWVFGVSYSDRRERRRILRRKSRKPRPRMPILKRTKVRFNPRLSYMGPYGKYSKYRDIKTNKDVYKDRKTGEVKRPKSTGVLV